MKTRIISTIIAMVMAVSIVPVTTVTLASDDYICAVCGKSPAEDKGEYFSCDSCCDKCYSADCICGIRITATEDDFVIENGILVKYNHKGEAQFVDVIIPNSVTHINDQLFKTTTIGFAPWRTWTVSSVTIGNNVTHIGEQAFGGSTITSITFPKSVTHIGEGAFFGNYNLETITFLSPVPPEIGRGFIADGMYYIPPTTIYVPIGTKSSYEPVLREAIYFLDDDGTIFDEVVTIVEVEMSPNFISGRIIDIDTETSIFDALEILKFLVGMTNKVANNPAALITAEAQDSGTPTIFDALEILKKLVGMENKIDN